ncbi:hypothetical protein BVY03_02860 [bacterium K02(2017)]|nr:hypothetical protein BVY03_02860 [bacterium K02(2017)]
MTLAYQIKCISCRLPLNLCLCAQMPWFKLKTRVVLLMQWGEHKVISNTGHLIPKIFPNSEIRFRGSKDEVPLNVERLFEADSAPYVLYPLGGAKELNADFVKSTSKPLTLIVPDGNWRQASKMVKRIPALQSIPKLTLPVGPPSRYRLRSTKQVDGVCTLEAIARALEIIEGQGIQGQVERYFTLMVERMLWLRSKLKASEVTGGIPNN